MCKKILPECQVYHTRYEYELLILAWLEGARLYAFSEWIWYAALTHQRKGIKRLLDS